MSCLEPVHRIVRLFSCTQTKIAWRISGLLRNSSSYALFNQIKYGTDCARCSRGTANCRCVLLSRPVYRDAASLCAAAVSSNCANFTIAVQMPAKKRYHTWNERKGDRRVTVQRHADTGNHTRRSSEYDTAKHQIIVPPCVLVCCCNVHDFITLWIFSKHTNRQFHFSVPRSISQRLGKCKAGRDFVHTAFKNTKCRTNYKSFTVKYLL